MLIQAIVLAAGEGRRAGGPKALLRLDGQTFLARSVQALSRPHVDGILAVLGHELERVRGAVPSGVPVLHNTRVADGMLSSLWLGLAAAAEAGAEAVLVHPVDHPLVSAATVDGVVAALRAGAAIAVPTHDGRRGHPTGFAASTWAPLRAAPLDLGARAVLAAHPEWVTSVPADETCRLGVNTLDDLRALEAWLSASRCST